MNDLLAANSRLIEEYLLEYCSSLSLTAPLSEAVAYAIFPKGKRIRPALALALTEDLAGNSSDFIRPSLALELVHASSLVHDDLPALDNDDFRRGKPSCHKAFGEATAILAGDTLIAEAFALAADPCLSDQQAVRLTRILSSAFRDVCHGQQRDILTGEERGSLELLHSLKTGSLFRASTLFAAAFSNLADELISPVAELGENIGLLFQVQDDLMDLLGDSHLKGRPQGSDQRNNRQTFGTSYALPELKSKLVAMTELIEQNFSSIEQGALRICTQTRNLFTQAIVSSSEQLLGK